MAFPPPLLFISLPLKIMPRYLALLFQWSWTHRASSLVFWGFLYPNSWMPNKGKGKSKHLEIIQCSSYWLCSLLGCQHSRFTQRRGHPAMAEVPRTTSRYPFGNCKLGFLNFEISLQTHRHASTVYMHLPHSPSVSIFSTTTSSERDSNPC